MSNVKHIDAKAFKEAGFLQEANRQWFHPHGLALELTIITEGEDAPLTRVSLSPAQLETLKALLFMEQSIPHYKPENAALEPKEVEALGDAIDKAITYGVGDCHFSGCWDYRDDPEGIYYGSWDNESAEKAARVLEERRKHYFYRARMFGQAGNDGLEAEADRIGTKAVLDSDIAAGRDIEPVGFVPADEASDG